MSKHHQKREFASRVAVTRRSRFSLFASVISDMVDITAAASRRKRHFVIPQALTVAEALKGDLRRLGGDFQRSVTKELERDETSR